MFCARSFTLPRHRAATLDAAPRCTKDESGRASKQIPYDHPSETAGTIIQQHSPGRTELSEGLLFDSATLSSLGRSDLLGYEHENIVPDLDGRDEGCLVLHPSIFPQQLVQETGFLHGEGLCDLTQAAVKENAAHWEQATGSKRQWSLNLLLGPPEVPLWPSGDLTGATPETWPLSKRSLSIGSTPSLDDSSSTSDDSIPSPRLRKDSSLPRKISRASECSLDVGDDHPLFAPDMELEGLDFRVFDISRQGPLSDEPLTRSSTCAPRRSAFKAHLISSLRVLKLAATSLSGLTSPVLMPEDFLTRSIVAIDPRLPFTDERMPQFSGDRPPAALRRYLNPAVATPPDQRPSILLGSKIPCTKCSASIQLKTYRIRRADDPSSSGSSIVERKSEMAVQAVGKGPVTRPRDVRENGDFIRIAVLEMAMRRIGKLDAHKAGHARWVLPPRQASHTTYGIGPDGVPHRWRSFTAQELA